MISRRAVVGAVAGAAAALVGGRVQWPTFGFAPGLAAQAVALKDVVPREWLIGAAINQNQSDGRDTVAVDLITRQFNTISPENLLKFQSLHPEPDRFTFDAADRYVAFGRDRRMAVIGHNLVWHSQTPRWVWDGPDSALADRATMLARMRTHIMTVVGRYAGRIRGWDVVNEALNEDGTLRDSPWRRGIGDDYIARAFEFANEADPKAELYYNDFNLATRPEKRAGAIRIITDLQQRGIRIDAVGEQGHWRLDAPPPAELDQAIRDLGATGLKVMITELDVNLLPPASPSARGQPPSPESNPYASGLPDDMQQSLARYYADTFRVLLTHRDHISRVTFWGVSDADSWLNRGRVNHPLLWDRQRQPKPAFERVVAVLRNQ
ncbi:MAG TPA: endo-1,4-beta-xylanase [Vicinamibacterales bacterium]